MLKKNACFALFLLVSKIIIAQTCIIAIGTENEIVIGADSKAHSLDGNDHLMCKLAHAKNIVFGASGYIFPGMQDSIMELLTGTEGLTVRTRSLGLRLMPIIDKYIDNVRISHFATYHEMFHKDSLLCNVLICSFENGIPQIENLYFTLDSTSNGKFFPHPRLRETPFVPAAKPFKYDLIGEAGCMEELGQDSVERIIAHNNKYRSIRRFIYRQSEITPAHVSPPINMIRIRPDNSIEWIERSQVCN